MTRPVAVLRTTLIVGALVALALLAWQLSEVLLLGFAAVLFASVLRAIAGPIEDHTPLNPILSLLSSGLLLALVGTLFILLLGSQIYSQLSSLIDQLPDHLSDLGDRLGMEDLHEQFFDRAEEFSERDGLVGEIAGYTS